MEESRATTSENGNGDGNNAASASPNSETTTTASSVNDTSGSTSDNAAPAPGPEPAPAASPAPESAASTAPEPLPAPVAAPAATPAPATAPATTSKIETKPEPQQVAQRDLSVSTATPAPTPAPASTVTKMGVPVLKGDFSFSAESGKFEWRGHWAMSEAAFASGHVSEFEYSFKPTSPFPLTSDKSSVLQHGQGGYSGFFLLNDASAGKQTKIPERNIAFTFSDDGDSLGVLGRGKNRYGHFELRGRFNPADGKLFTTKVYLKPPPRGRRGSAAKRKLSTPRTGKKKAGAAVAPAIAAHLRGTLEFDKSHSHWIWKGRWALNPTAFSTPGANVQPFSYSSGGPKNAVFADPISNRQQFCQSASTVYAGDFSFTQEAAPGTAAKTATAYDSMTMTYEPDTDDTFKVTGGGTNVFGTFTIDGVYDPASQSLQCTKRYTPLKVVAPRPMKTPASQRAKPRSTPVSSVTGGTRGSSRRVKAPPKYRDPDPLEGNPLLLKCKVILEQLFASSHSRIFRQPVDVVAYPEYTKWVTNPIDLSTIRKKLETGHYLDPQMFITDVRLMFQNSYTFNRVPEEAAHIVTTRLEKLFETKVKSLIALIEKKNRPRGSSKKAKTPAASRAKKKPAKRRAAEPDSSDESSDESESEEESDSSEDSSDDDSSDDDSSDDEARMQKDIKKLMKKVAALKRKKKKKKERKRKLKEKEKARKRKRAAKKKKPQKKKARPSAPSPAPAPRPTPKPRPKKPVTQKEKVELLSQMKKVIHILGETFEQSIMDIIITSTNINPEEEDVNIDLEMLPDVTLRSLQTFIRGVMRNKRNQEKFKMWERTHGEFEDEFDDY